MYDTIRRGFRGSNNAHDVCKTVKVVPLVKESSEIATDNGSLVLSSPPDHYSMRL